MGKLVAARPRSHRSSGKPGHALRCHADDGLRLSDPGRGGNGWTRVPVLPVRRRAPVGRGLAAPMATRWPASSFAAPEAGSAAALGGLGAAAPGHAPSLRAGILDHVPADLTDRLAPDLVEHCERVAKHPGVVTYYDTH